MKNSSTKPVLSIQNKKQGHGARTSQQHMDSTLQEKLPTSTEVEQFTYNWMSWMEFVEFVGAGQPVGKIPGKISLSSPT